MSTQDNGNPNINMAAEFQRKFELYFVSLIFTVLALSIQTSVFSEFGFQYRFEIGAWSLLIISGLSGLLRLEYVPVVLNKTGIIEIAEADRKIIGRSLRGEGSIKNQSGEEWAHEKKNESKENLEKFIANGKKENEKTDRRLLIQYNVQKWGFYFGLMLLAISRGLLQFQNMLK